MAEHQCVQGDNFAYDFTSRSVPSFEDTWTGTWTIIDELGDDRTIFATGDIDISADRTKLEMRILPAETEIAIGFYLIVVQITNVSIGFNKEIMQDSFEITKQGA